MNRGAATEADTPATSEEADRVRRPLEVLETVPIAAFDAAYAGFDPFTDAPNPERLPWEIGAPQAGIVALSEAGHISGKVLDVGCGTGENALFLASRGIDVVGIDASATAVAAARAKADQRFVEARFVVGDALCLKAIGEQFDCVIDSGLLHQFSSDDRRRLINGIHAVLRPGGVYHLLCFSRRRPPPAPRRLGRKEIVDAFGPERGAGPERPPERGAGPERPPERGAGPERPSERGARPRWRIDSLVASRYDVLDGNRTPNAWLGRIVRLP